MDKNSASASHHQQQADERNGTDNGSNRPEPGGLGTRSMLGRKKSGDDSAVHEMPNLEHPAIPLLAGFLGGSSPRLLHIIQKLQEEVLPTPGLLVAVAALATVGSVVVWAFKETNRTKAFVMGIGAPAIIYSAAQAASAAKVPSATKAAEVLMESVVSVAHASPDAGKELEDDSTEPAKRSDSAVVLSSGEAEPNREKVLQPITVEVEGISTTPIKVQAVTDTKLGATLFLGNDTATSLLPEGTSGISIMTGTGGEDVQFASLLARTEPLTLTVKVVGSFWSDFLDGLGLSSLAQKQKHVEIELRPTPSP